jgi:hypothetical protein
MIWDMALPPESSFDAMQRAVLQNQRFLNRWPVQMKAASAVQLMKRKREAAPSGSGKPPGKPPDDGNAPKKAKEKEEEESVFEKKVRMIHAIIGMIIARLNGGNQAPPRIPTLSSMASRSLADQLPDAMGPDKRGWQFASVGLLPSVSGGMGTVTFASNDMRDLRVPTANLSGMQKMTSMPGAETRKSIARRVYHTETRQLAEGCRHIAVTGGLNCIFCSLYFLYNNVPFTYHTGAVASWHLPQNLSVAQFFGDAIRDYIQSADFRAVFGVVANAQGLIDILCGATSLW